MPQRHDPIFSCVVEAVCAGRAGLLNARGEFACNSSSSHSIVILPEARRVGLRERAGAGDYGWERFTLTSSTEKLRYLAATLTTHQEDPSVVALGGCADAVSGASDDYVDHQSLLEVVRTRDGAVDRSYFAALAALLEDPRVAVLGGNDNDGDHPLSGAGIPVVLPKDVQGSWVARRDELAGHEWWVLFNRSDGTKVRVSLVVDDIAAGFVPDKAPAPELVDIKLTDRCAFEADCGFCYMGSTRTGDQARAAQVENLLCALSDLGVFEVAFGGGEPTLWRPFGEVLAFARRVGVVPNFTSKNYKVLTTHPEWIETCGAAAFSVNDLACLNRFDDAYRTLDKALRPHVGIQCVPELCDEATFDALVGWADANEARLTLLGYKETGRGAGFTGRIRRPAEFWIERVARYQRVAVDTVLAAQCADALEEAGAAKWSYHTKEGKFSAYVDAVRSAMGPSSFAGSLDPLNLAAPAEQVVEDLRERFARY